MTLLQTSITAPTKGFLVIQANGSYFTSPTPLIHCGIAIDGDSDTWPGTFGLSSNSATSLSTTSCGLPARVPVTAGTHTVAYQAHNDGSGSVTYAGGSMTVTFIANGSTGGLGTGRQLQRVTGGDVNKR